MEVMAMTEEEAKTFVEQLTDEEVAILYDWLLTIHNKQEASSSLLA